MIYRLISFLLFTIQTGTMDFDYQEPQNVPESGGSMIWRMIIVLIIIVPIIYGVIYLLKKLKSKQILFGSPSDTFEIIERIPVGQNKQICLFRVKGKILFLGVTEKNINLIKEMDEKELFNNTEEL